MHFSCAVFAGILLTWDPLGGGGRGQRSLGFADGGGKYRTVLLEKKTRSGLKKENLTLVKYFTAGLKGESVERRQGGAKPCEMVHGLEETKEMRVSRD